MKIDGVSWLRRAGWWGFEGDSRCQLAAWTVGNGSIIGGWVECGHGPFGEVAAVADLPLVVHAAETAPTSLVTAASLGKMPTTRARRLKLPCQEWVPALASRWAAAECPAPGSGMMAPSSPGSRPSPSGGLRPALTAVAGGALSQPPGRDRADVAEHGPADDLGQVALGDPHRCTPVWPPRRAWSRSLRPGLARAAPADAASTPTSQHLSVTRRIVTTV